MIFFGCYCAPDVGTIFLVSFINVGKRLYSSSETFMVFGGYVGENSLPVRRFLEKAMLSFIYLQSKVFSLVIGEEIVKVEFSLTELPNDIKMLSFLSGELSNAATYFTTFANVNTNNYRDYEKTFGKDWVPFSYDKRISDSKKVAKFKSDLDKTKNAKVTKRAKVTKFIASLKSRQEEEPLVKHFVSNAKCEPLHLKNNVCKDLFMKMWHVIYAPLSFDKVKSFSDLAENNVFRMLVSFVKCQMKLNMLAMKMISWFNETNRFIERDFHFRFRGEESFSFLKYFPLLVSKFLPLVISNDCKTLLLQHFYEMLHIRKLISYSVRLSDFTESDLAIMMTSGRKLFKACCRFEISITPSLWVLSNIAPHHAKETLRMYNLGLGVNSMEPREQKHQVIKKYGDNTTPQNKWPMIFRHEYLQLIYLREKGYDELNYKRKSRIYLPAIKDNSCSNCGLHLTLNVCVLCSHSIYIDISDSLN